MTFSKQLLDAGERIWDAQKEHPFVHELAAGTLDEAAFKHWVKQDYRYLFEYARDEATMTHLFGVANKVLDHEMDLNREFAADYGISTSELETVEKAPTCVAYTNFLVRTAYEGSIAEHMAELADEDYRYTPFIEMYTGDEFRETTDWCREFVNQCGEQYPGGHDAMQEALLTRAKLEYQFWERLCTQEGWDL